ncbi:MAG: ABC transporter permease [Phycisphaerales bacterium]|jgi:ABC-type dipeptide/oligopeptide/nickel transport system permease subunit|nr:ABC transporter permease [Phycisphaerales bacterium]
MTSAAVESNTIGFIRRIPGHGRLALGGGFVALMLLVCIVSLPWTNAPGGTLYYNNQESTEARRPPRIDNGPKYWFGTDGLGRSLLGRCLIGGAISLLIGASAALISVVLGVSVGLIAGYRGGWVDGLLMRMVDVLYGLPYILMVILFKIALEPLLQRFMGENAANLVVLFLAIGLVSWLTMARVVRGQVMSLRTQPFVEAARACGAKESRIFIRHLLPNLAGPIIVYATLTIPSAILQESFLSFLGVGIKAPMPTWGSLASDGLMPALNTIHSRWWMLVFPCTLLALTLLSLNFLGDGLRDLLDTRDSKLET